MPDADTPLTHSCLHVSCLMPLFHIRCHALLRAAADGALMRYAMLPLHAILLRARYDADAYALILMPCQPLFTTLRHALRVDNMAQRHCAIAGQQRRGAESITAYAPPLRAHICHVSDELTPLRHMRDAVTQITIALRVTPRRLRDMPCCRRRYAADADVLHLSAAFMMIRAATLERLRLMALLLLALC